MGRHIEHEFLAKQITILISISIVSFFISCGGHASHHIIEISLEINWTFHADSNYAKTYPATVPGTVHTDLLRNGLIPDPFYGNNEQSNRHLEDISWVYETTFQVADELLKYDRIQLAFEGLDTYGTIFLNGDSLGSTNNMFRVWDFDCKSFLKKGANELKIKFTPPAQFNHEKASRLDYVLPADNEEAALKISPFTRKAPYHFGWDWGPRMVTSGIWKPVALRGWNIARIEEVAVTLGEYQESTAHMIANVIIDADKSGRVIEVVVGTQSSSHRLKSGENKIEVSFLVHDPKRWWPNGHGDPHLYNERIEVHYKGNVIDKREVRFGIRNVELINEPDSIGTSFYFLVNDKPLFIQGANYIPQDVFLPRVSDKQYRELLYATKEANMNMIRVWGGGVYERDIFYDLCDSLGLLVWQDFMFAGTMYPGDEEFVKNVTAETKQQVRRLRKHPSLALWCGNNELEVAWFNWGWQKKYNYSEVDSTKIWNDYLRLFRDILPGMMKFESPEINYTPTSPLSNWGAQENFNHSSMHYWGVWHGRDKFNSFKHNIGRFMVEYGMQSYPDLSTIRKFAPESELALDSDIMKNRQKSYIGNAEILKHVLEHFHKPKDFAEFVMLSQESQGKALEIAIRAHKNSNGHCMGTMLWQLNDCWPGPSWSLIDYYGNKKKAYEVVKREFSKN